MSKHATEHLLNKEDKQYIKEVYAKIKELKEEIEFTKNNNLIKDIIKKQKYINTLEFELNKCYDELKFIEKQLHILEHDKNHVDDYLDKKGSVKQIEFVVGGNMNDFNFKKR